MQTESSKWAKGTEAYFKVIDSRRDERIQSIPERYDMYEYMTRVAWF